MPTRPPVAVVALPLVAALAGCDNDVDLLSREAPLPVVYGVFAATDDLQIVSVTKTFAFARDGGAREAALAADSVYYGPEVAVVVANDRTGASVVAERFAAADEGVVREAGDFAPAPNVLYRFDASALGARPGDRLEVAVEREGARLATAGADVLPELSFLQARQPPARIAFSSEVEYALSWRRGEAAAAELAVYELGFVFAFRETDPSGRTTDRELYYPAGVGLDADADAASVRIDGFYDFLAARLEADSAVTRAVRYAQLVITGGDADFVAYADLLRANAGITATQQLPPFTNVDGGLGVYAGITQLRQDTFGTLTPDSFDELRDGERTRALNFE